MTQLAEQVDLDDATTVIAELAIANAQRAWWTKREDRLKSALHALMGLPDQIPEADESVPVNGLVGGALALRALYVPGGSTIDAHGLRAAYPDLAMRFAKAKRGSWRLTPTTPVELSWDPIADLAALPSRADLPSHP